METFSRNRDAAIPQSLHHAWLRACEDWSSPLHHDELLQLAMHHECYAWLAAKYRDVGRTRDVPAIDAYLNRLRRAAEATLTVSATRRTAHAAGSYSSAQAILLVLIAALVASCVYARTRAVPTRSASGNDHHVVVEAR